MEINSQIRTGKMNLTRREWRPLVLPAQGLCWVLIALLGLPPAALAHLCNDDGTTCPSCTSGGAGGGSGGGGGPGGGGGGRRTFPSRSAGSGSSQLSNGNIGGSSGFRGGGSRGISSIGSHDPVNLGRMSVYMWATDFEPTILPGARQDASLHFTRYHSSDDVTTLSGGLPQNGPLGYNWTHNYNILLLDTGPAVRIKGENCTEQVFNMTSNIGSPIYENISGGNSRLSKVGVNFVWQMRNGTKYTFDGTNANRLATIVDTLTNTLTLTYGATSLLTNVADQFGRNLRFAYNGSGLIFQMIDPVNGTNAFYYDASGQLTNVVDSFGAKDVYTYDGAGSGRVSAITNPRGKTHTYVYDAAGKVTSETNAAGAVMVFDRDDVAHTVDVTDRNGNHYSHSFNSDSRLTGVQDSAGSMTLVLDDNNRATNFVNRLGFGTRSFFAPNSCGCQIAGGLIMSIDSLNRTNQWEIETNFNKAIAFTNALGNVSHFGYDTRGNLTNITDGAGKVTRQIYDAAGNFTQFINANNATNKFGYDQYGNRTNSTDALGGVSRYQYDLVGNFTNRVDALNRTNCLVRDARDRVVRAVDALGGGYGWSYDGQNNLLTQTNELQQVTSYTYDNVDRTATVTLPAGDGVFTSCGYDGNGNRVAVTNALGNKTGYGFDAVNRMTKLTNALMKVWSFAYDAESRMTSSTDANNHSTTFGYDAANQLTSLTNALTQTIQFQYDLAGNRTNIIDGRGNVLGFRYNAVNRLTNLVYAASDLETFGYDAVGNLTNYITRAGDANSYTYDAANRLTNITYVGGSDVISFGYDAGSQLTGALWKNGTATNANDTFSYDLNGRLTNETQTVAGSSPKVVGYTYDAAGRRTQLTYPDGTFITYGYNANGWLTNIADGGSNSIVVYTYDAAGRRTKRQLENNTFTVYDYDSADQITNIMHVKAVSGVTNTLSQYSYGYDDAGNRKWVKRLSGKGDVFKYDDTDQLTNVLYDATNPDTTPSAATNEARYIFDAAGNRNSVTSTNTGMTSYVPNALNQYTNIGGTTMKYDGNGNPTNIMENGVTLALTYDRENRLITMNNGTVTVTNTYDVFDRLVERATGTGKLRFVYDNQWRVLAEYNGSDMLVNRYVYGPEVDEPVRVTAPNNRFYYHQAVLGTVTEMTGPAGNVRERYFYDVYGRLVNMTDASTNVVASSLMGNRFMFQGRDRDPDTGLYNFRNRFYSPTLGRFLQVDPIRQEGGENIYAFVRNDPVNYYDPHGLLRADPPDPAPPAPGEPSEPAECGTNPCPGFVSLWPDKLQKTGDKIPPVPVIPGKITCLWAYRVCKEGCLSEYGVGSDLPIAESKACKKKCNLDCQSNFNKCGLKK